MKIDFLWLPDEPASCTHYAVGELHRAGLLGTAIASTPANAEATIEHCRRTDADFILFFSGNVQLHWLFDTEAKRSIWQTMKVPRVCWATEQSIGSPFPKYKEWAKERMACFTHYLVASARDVSFYAGYAPTSWCPMWGSTEVFKPVVPWKERVRRTCFIGLTEDYHPGVFQRRRELLQRLKTEGLLDHLHIPRHVYTAPAVAAIYATYAATIQLPTTGYAYGVRAFEATAAGALLIFCRGAEARVEPDLFPGGTYSMHYDPADTEGLVALLRDIDWVRAEQIAMAGHKRFKALFAVQPSIKRILHWMAGGPSIDRQLGIELPSDGTGPSLELPRSSRAELPSISRAAGPLVSRSEAPTAAQGSPQIEELFGSLRFEGWDESAVRHLWKETRRVLGDAPVPVELCMALRERIKMAPDSDPLVIPSHAAPLGDGSALSLPRLAKVLAGTPVGGWTMAVEPLNWLIQMVNERRPASVVEFGSGISTLVLAEAMRSVHGEWAMPRVWSVEQSAEELRRTEAKLKSLQLSHIVRLIHAPLGEQRVADVTSLSYLLSQTALAEFLDGARPDLVLIDGPAGPYGARFGVLPLIQKWLAPSATILLDDALRDSELSTLWWWEKLRLLQPAGIRWLGNGLLEARCGVASGVEPDLPACKTALSLPPPFRRAHDGAKRASRTEPNGPASPRAQNRVRSCLFVNTYYSAFIESVYRKNPELAGKTYLEQKESLLSLCFGDSDFYSQGLRLADWQADDVIVNCAPLQQAWAKENRCSLQLLEIAVAQIACANPDVIYLQDLSLATPEFLAAIRPYVRLIVGQIACPLPERADVRGLDIVFSSFPHFVQRFREQGITSYYMPLAFEPRVLDRLGMAARKRDVTFVGGLSAAHARGTHFLETLATSVPIEFWGYGVDTLAPDSPIRGRHHGEVWGTQMFELLSQSRLTINRHIDVAENYANNMRLFEATGCGALLVTDYRDNLNELFDIGKEVVAYRDAEECAALVRYYLANPEKAEQIARAGQRRTLRDHTYTRRMQSIAEILDRHLQRREGNNGSVSGENEPVSCGYEVIASRQVTPELTSAWKSEAIPARQRRLVHQQLESLYRGNPPEVFRVLADVLRPVLKSGMSVVEIGCSSGYYSEILSYLLRVPFRYAGVDYSPAMIALAKEHYPRGAFHLADGANLPFGDSSFDIAISSGVLLHVPNYREHVAEAARVASSFVVAHRTPICRQRPTQYLTKMAYGVKTVELRFNEGEFLFICADQKLRLLGQIEYEARPEGDAYEVTYLFSKKRPSQ